MDWVTENTAQEGAEVVSQLGTVVVAHEISEDQAKRSYDDALRHLQKADYIAAKEAFAKVLKCDIPQTPFRTRLFRATLKNLARCYENLGMPHRAVESAVRATEFLERDDQDVSVWLLIRRLSFQISHLPLFKLSESVLQGTVPSEEFVNLPEPTEVPYNVFNAPLPTNEVCPILFVFLDAENITWEDFVKCLREVKNDDRARFQIKESSFQTSEMIAPVNLADVIMRENDAKSEDSLLDLTPSDTKITGDQAVVPQTEGPAAQDAEHVEENASAIAEEVTAPNSATKKRKEFGVPVRFTKRQLMQATDLQAEFDVSPAPRETNLSDLLPSENQQTSQTLLQWFERHSNDASGLSMGGTMSPIKSPVAEGTAARKAHDSLLGVLRRLSSLGSLTGHEILSLVLSFCVEQYLSVPTEVLASLYRSACARGIQISEDQKWLGMLSIAEMEDTLETLTKSEAMDLECDLQYELVILSFALETSNSDLYPLARKTLKRCIRRASVMQRPLLGKLSIDRLEEIQTPDDAPFIAYSRAKLNKTDSQERVDQALLDCAVNTSRFSKDYQACLKHVLDICLQENSIVALIPYCLDVIKKGLARHDKPMCKAALKYLKENVVATPNIDDQDGLLETLAQVFSRLIRTFPRVLKRVIVDILAPKLWPQLIASFWIWASNERKEKLPEFIFDFLTKFTTTADYFGLSEEHLPCVIHAMVKLGCYRNALMIWKQMDLESAGPAAVATNAITQTRELGWAERRLDFCELCLKKDPIASDVCFELLLHDSRLNSFLNATNISKPVDVDMEMAATIGAAEGEEPQMDTSFLSDFETSRWDLNLRRERILNSCVEFMYFKRDQTQDPTSVTGSSSTTPTVVNGSLQSSITSGELPDEDVANLWEFLAPHLWPTKTIKLTTVIKGPEKVQLLNYIQPYIARAPQTEPLANIERGGFWYHFSKNTDVSGNNNHNTRGGRNNSKKDEDGSGSGNDDDRRQEDRVTTDTLTRSWCARDVSVEPQRLSSLFELAQILYEDANPLGKDDQPIAAALSMDIATESRAGSAGGDLVGSGDDLAKRAEKYRLLKTECLTLLEEIIAIIDKRQQGSTAMASQLSASTSTGARSSVTGHSAGGTVKIGTLVTVREAGDDKDEGDVEDEENKKTSAAIIAGLHPVRNPQYADIVMREDNEVRRWVPLDRLTPIPDVVLADVLPEDLDVFKIDVHQYLALVRRDLNDKELDRGLDEAIALCEQVKSDSTWSFYWFKGICLDDRECYQSAHEAITKLNQERKFKSKAQSKSFAFKVAQNETTTRLCVCDLEEAEGTSEEEEVKKACVVKLKQAFKDLDSGNLESARLLQELAGCEDDSLQETLDKKVIYDTDAFFLLDEYRRREWDAEMELAVQARMKALKERKKPLHGILALFDTFRLKKGRMKDVKRKQDGMVAFLLEMVLPSLTLQEAYELSLRCRWPGALKANTEEKLMELGMAEFGKTVSFAEILNRCKQQFKALAEKYKPHNAKLHKSAQASSSTTTTSSNITMVSETVLGSSDQQQTGIPPTATELVEPVEAEPSSSQQ